MVLTSFKLIDGVGPSQYSGPEDTLTTKRALSTLGLYGRDSLSDTSDSEMFEGLKTEQRRNLIHPDGVMNPDGPTHWMLSADVKARRSGQPVRGSLGLKIGFGLAETPSAERRQVGQALNTLNLLNRREAEDLDAQSSGLRRFQMLVNEKPDGVARPGGRTETKLAKAAYGMSPANSRPGMTGTRTTRPTITASPELQLASASLGTGLWNNPTVWSLKQAGKAVKESGKRAGSLLDLSSSASDVTREKSDVRWSKHFEQGELQPGGTDTTYLVQGPVQVERNSSTFAAVEGGLYSISWHPLNPDGTLQTIITEPGFSVERIDSGFIPLLGESRTFRPPRHNKHGWQFRISVPPQMEVNGNSAGVQHRVRLPEGEQQKVRSPFPNDWFEIE